jgi:hypothetical protein
MWDRKSRKEEEEKDIDKEDCSYSVVVIWAALR